MARDLKSLKECDFKKESLKKKKKKENLNSRERDYC